MRTGNLFVLLCLMTLTLGEERTTESRSAKNLGEKYEHVGNAKIKDSDSNDGGENALGNRNDRAIDAHSAPSKSNQQFTKSNLPKSNLKPSEKGYQKGRHFRNMTIANGICQSIDIRNSVDYFTMLQGCVVIEGFLQIVLIEPKKKELSANADAIVDFQNVSFPLLREITGYLVLYRVNGLKSLSNLFPNLEVIRGEILLTDYSFMIYEMPHLQEIGLKKLTKITRGAVRIEKNSALCFTKTVDWDAIVVAGENVIKDNSNEASCPGCPKCPTEYCWTAKDCQDKIENKCHEQCLGDCSGPTASDCFVCKNYRREGICVDSCPPNLYSYLSRRCITKEECMNINVLLNPNKKDHDQTYHPFNGVCTTQCPDGYEDFIDENNNKTCRVCKEFSCRKIGPGAIIRHMSDAQPFRGITIVKGSLEFQIRNGNPSIMDELTKSFGQIEEITGHLKVAHSFPLTSLNFFKKLKVIRGAPTDINNSSLVVLDNPNLASLFAEGQRVEILHGRLFFHYNPKLCLTKIVELGKMAGITNLSSLEVQPESNGEKVACDVTDIAINVKEKSSSDVTLIWQRYEPRGGQRLLSYLLNYMETDNENITYEANSCGSNSWQIIDVDIPDSNSRPKTISKRIPNLKPYTRYAVYVKTFAARNQKSVTTPVGQSKIIFFRTMSDVPTMPTDVVSIPMSDSKISVMWNPPEYPNGPIGYYMLSGFIREDDAEILSSRDYCSDGLVDEQEEEPQEVTVITTIVEPDTCCKRGTVQKASSKKFEIFCHENITLSYLSPGRKDYCLSRRYNDGDAELVNLDSKFINPRIPVNEPTGNDISPVMDDSKTRFRNGTYYSFVFNVSAQSNSYLLDKLRHYSLYTIAVAACGGYELRNATVKCSSIQYTNTRTLGRPSADDVRNVKVQVSNDTIVIVSWDPAREPNSLTVAYTVEYTNLDVKDAKKSTECVPEKKYREKRGTYSIKNLSPGRYSLRVRSMSLAGDGNFSGQVRFSIGLKENNSMIIAVLLVLACVSAVAIAVFVVSRRRQRKKKQARLIASVNPDYIETTYVIDSWEVARENVEILEELGLGNFGMVYRGRLNANQEVAIKTISETASQREKNEFLNEASVMKNFSTFHIIKLLGVVSKGNPPFVIMELMENGDLKTYLRRIRDTHLVPNATRIVRMAAEIADGMSYLESKKFVHRDLAARNCMVSKDLVCKIGDFGMARDIYETDYYKVGKKGLLPIRWMAPENLSDGVFTSDSDVWSYGVVLYEILTLAEIPYQGFSNEEVLNYVLRKGLLTIPRNCPENIYKIMEKCFKWRPSERPTFMEIVAELEPFLGQDFCESSFYHSEEGVEIRNLGIKKIYHHAAPIRFHWGNETARWVREFEDNVTLLDQTKAGTSRGRIFKNGFQPFGNVTNLEDVPLDR